MQIPRKSTQVSLIQQAAARERELFGRLVLNTLANLSKTNFKDTVAATTWQMGLATLDNGKAICVRATVFCSHQINAMMVNG